MQQPLAFRERAVRLPQTFFGRGRFGARLFACEPFGLRCPRLPGAEAVSQIPLEAPAERERHRGPGVERARRVDGYAVGRVCLIAAGEHLAVVAQA